MTELGIVINTAECEVQWENHTTPLKRQGDIESRTNMAYYYHLSVNPAVMEAEQRQFCILDANYERVDLKEYIYSLTHLTESNRALLLDLLEQYPVLFGGGLGKLTIPPVHLELKPGSKPYHARPFPIPQSLEKTTKKEMERLTDIEVFEKNSDSEWAAPTFVQPKKTGDVRILTDFRKLNECLIRKPFPLPKIADMLQKLRNFKYATAIDLSMAYYHIPLNEHSQNYV